ncbi:MAG: DUF91 domain-containing protein [Candidatus Omnitrophica bacterium]|nr:DUF91 domain-containing protein [Candidatus Omnitrophota bacterium]
MTNKLNSRTDNKGRVVNDNSNSDIVELLAQGLSALERGLQAVKRDVPTPAGNIDILAVDMVGRIVIVEVCDSRSEDILFRAIDHFDWALSEMSALKQKLESYNIDPTLAPRILILAPSFTEKFVKRASYLNPNFIDIYEFQIKESMGSKKIYFRPFSFVNHKKWVLDLKTKSLDDHFNYLENPELKESLKNFIVELQSRRHDLVVDTSCGYIKIKDKSDLFVLGIYVLKNGFWINSSPKRWQGWFIKRREDLLQIKNHIFNQIRKGG